MSKSKFELFYDAIAENKSEETSEKKIEDINRLIAEDEDIKRLFTQPDECDKLLSCAISSGNDSALINSLLNNINDMEEFAPNALLLACKQGDKKVVKLLLNKKAASVNTTMASVTALSNACLSGNKSLVKLLLDRGADSNFTVTTVDSRYRLSLRDPYRDSNPAINAACAGGHIDIIKLLVEKLKFEIGDFYGSMNSPCTSAVRHHQIEILDYLLENYSSSVDKIKLIDCICDADNPAIIPLLEKHGFMKKTKITVRNLHRLDYESSYYQELLSNIFIKGSTRLFETLLKDTPALHNMLIRKTQIYPICLAVSHGHVDLVDRLIALGADLGVADEGGQSPLHLACFSGHVDIIDRLLYTGKCDINAVTNRGDTALTLLFRSYDGFSLGIVDRLIMMGINCNHQNRLGRTALMLAIIKEREDIVELLINVGVDVNQADNFGTPLMYAISRHQVRTVKLLLKHSMIDLNIINSLGQTAIDMADNLNNPEITALFAGLRETLPSSNRP